MGSYFFHGIGDSLKNPFQAFNRTDWGMHPSAQYQRPGGPVLNSGPWSGQAPTLAGAQAGYTPQSYAATAGKAGLLNPNQPPGG